MDVGRFWEGKEREREKRMFLADVEVLDPPKKSHSKPKGKFERLFG